MAVCNVVNLIDDDNLLLCSVFKFVLILERQLVINVVN